MVMQKTVNKLQKLQLRQVLIWIWNLDAYVGIWLGDGSGRKISENLVDAARRILKVKFQIGVVLYKYCDETAKRNGRKC
jgi:hypothetical protein